MSRIQDFNGQGKAITGGVAQSLVWTGSEIASERVVAYHIVFQGGTDFADVNRLRVNANGFPILNLTAAMLQAYVRRFSSSNLEIAATDLSFTIPLGLIDEPTYDAQDIAQFPVSSQVQIEMELLAGAVAGQAFIGYTQTNIESELHIKLLSQQMNIPASVTQARFNLAESGIVVGVSLPPAGIARARLVLGGESAFNLPGAQFGGLATGDMLREASRLEGVAGAVTTPLFHAITLGKPAPSSASFIELDTGAGWAGVANEICVFSVSPNMLEV